MRSARPCRSRGWPSASSRCSSWWRVAWPTRTSPARCSSPRTPSRTMCATSWRSFSCTRAWRPRCMPSARRSSTSPTDAAASVVALNACRRVVLTLDRLINVERCRNYSIIFIALGYGLVVVSTFMGHLPQTAFGTTVLPDYLAHWTGGRLVLDGQVAAVGQTSKLARFVSPPFVGLLYAPLAALPYVASAAAWTLISIAMLLAALKLARPLAPNIPEARWRMTVLVCFASQPVLELLGAGQDSALSLLVWVAGTRLILGRRDVLAGVLFALGPCKPQLFVLVPVVLLAQRRYRSFAAWSSTALALALISVKMVGVDGVRNWLALPFQDTYREAVQVGQAWKMQGLPSFVTALCRADYRR